MKSSFTSAAPVLRYSPHDSFPKIFPPPLMTGVPFPRRMACPTSGYDHFETEPSFLPEREGIPFNYPRAVLGSPSGDCDVLHFLEFDNVPFFFSGVDHDAFFFKPCKIFALFFLRLRPSSLTGLTPPLVLPPISTARLFPFPCDFSFPPLPFPPAFGCPVDTMVPRPAG